MNFFLQSNTSISMTRFEFCVAEKEFSPFSPKRKNDGSGNPKVSFGCNFGFFRPSVESYNTYTLWHFKSNLIAVRQFYDKRDKNIPVE